MQGNIIGNIILVTGAVGVIGGSIIRETRGHYRRKAEFRQRMADYRAAHPAMTGHWLDYETQSDAPLIIGLDLASGPDETVFLNRSPPVDFAALRGQPIKEWEHTGDPTPRPEHYDGVMRNIRTRSASLNADGSVSLMGDGIFEISDRTVSYSGGRLTDVDTRETLTVDGDGGVIPLRYAYSVPIEPGPDGRWWLMATVSTAGAKPQPTGNTYTRRSTALKACRQRNEAAAFKAKASPRPIAKR